MSFIKRYPQIKIIQEIAKEEKVAIYLVGGFLRDYCLEKEGKDFDFAVKKNALKIAELFAKKIRGAFVLLDKDRGCARVVKKHRGELYTFDFANYRARTIMKDLLLRDFTINTLSLNVAALDVDTEIEDVIVDLFHGLKDIDAKKIKMTSSVVFEEDPLRMLRAFSLKASLNFTIEPKTLTQIKRHKDFIWDVSYERIRDELFKILETERAAENLEILDRIGLLERVIPQVKVMYDCKQGGYHHLDVWPHSLWSVQQLEEIFQRLKENDEIHAYLLQSMGGNRSRLALMKLGSLLHDIGKPDTRKKEKQKLSFHGHEKTGKNIVKVVAKMLKLSTRERYALEDMVYWHLRPGYLSNFKMPTNKSIYRYFRDTHDEAVSILLISLADQKATMGPLTTKKDQRHHERICLDLVAKYFEKKKEKKFVPLVNGNDIMKKLKIKPSQLVGKILREVEEKQALGLIATKKEAFDVARNIYCSDP